MRKKFRIRIIAPAATDVFNQRILDTVKPVLPPDFEIDIRNLTEGKPCIQNRYDLTENAMQVVKLVHESEKEHIDGVFVTDFDMCGVEATREVVQIPVIGGFRASAYTAMMLSQRFSIITILKSTIAMQREHIRTFGLEKNFASIRSIDCPVSDLEHIEKAISLVTRQGLKAITEDGAGSLILGCTGFIGVADRVSQELSEILGATVPVMDPNRVALGYLVLLVRNHLTQSGLCYPKPTNG